LQGIALTYGAAAPLLCLAAVETVVETVDCPEDGVIDCPQYGYLHRTFQLDAEALQPEATFIGQPVLFDPSTPASTPPCRNSKINGKKGSRKDGLGVENRRRLRKGGVIGIANRVEVGPRRSRCRG
jgi:hypothetical protein